MQRDPAATQEGVLPEHGGDHLPGKREDRDPDAGDGDSLEKLVKLVVCEC